MAASYQDFTGTTSKVKDFTFPYIKQSDIKVRKTTAAGVVTELVEGTLTSQSPGQYTWTNATRITINDAPVSGDTIRVYRDTASDALVGTFYPGSAIRSSDLNDNFTQNLYVTQEAEDSVDSAVTDAATALTKATTADANATTALNNSQDLSADPSSAIAIAQAAETTANNAKSQAETAEAAVSSVLPYTIVANKAALLAASVTEDDIYEVTDTTDMEDLGDSDDVIWVNAAGSTSGQDIAALKPNVTWDSGITLKMKKYGTNNTDRKWIFQSYFANDPESKYAGTASPTFTGTPAAPTAGSSTNTTQIATTAFAQPRDADLTSLSSCQSGGAAALAALTSTEIEILDGATVSTTELNILDGVTSTTSELNILDGVTSTATELNLLDGKTVVGDAVLASDQSWTGAQRGTIVDFDGAGGRPAVAATTTIDFSVGNNFYIDLADANVTTVNASNATAGQSGSIIVRGHGSNKLAGWNAVYKWGTPAAPTITADTAKFDRIDYFIHDASNINMVWSGNY